MIERFELRHLRYFVAVAEELHFGKAARRLGIAQPPLSLQIRHLEESLGAQLFERTSRRVALTAAGHHFLEASRDVLASVHRAAETARRAAKGETGTLSVAFAWGVMFRALPKMIREFREKLPGVRLELRELVTGQQMIALRSGELDIGILRQAPPDQLILREPIMRETLHIGISKDHPLAKRRRVTLHDLRDEGFVFLPADFTPRLHAQIIGLCEEAGFAPRPVQESRELYTMVSLVEANIGVTILPDSVRQMGWQGVRYYPIRSKNATSVVEAAWHAENSNSRVVQAFLDIARSYAKT